MRVQCSGVAASTEGDGVSKGHERTIVLRKPNLGYHGEAAIVGQFPITAAGSTGRCNSAECIDPGVLAQWQHLFRATRSKPSQGAVPGAPSLACDFSFCCQYQLGSSFVLRRPIEITALIGTWQKILSNPC